ncbi:MAG: hypothetical protein RJA57_5 [Bacteroidota bacterium]|jgi:ferritin-like metal-binding protein YciE
MKDNTLQQVCTLHELLDLDARRFSHAEVQLRQQLPGWIDEASSLKLKEVLRRYLEQVNRHIDRFNAFIATEGIRSLHNQSRVMSAFLEEAAEKRACCSDTEVRDACLLASIQLINHYKISLYGTAAAYATALEMPDAAALFREAEANEKQVDDRLTQLALFEINPKARNPVLIED